MKMGVYTFRLRKMPKALIFVCFALFEGSYLLKHLEWKLMFYAVVDCDSLLASSAQLSGGGLVILKHTTAFLSSEC